MHVIVRPFTSYKAKGIPPFNLASPIVSISCKPSSCFHTLSSTIFYLQTYIVLGLGIVIQYLDMSTNSLHCE
jgi:hypothetical protein